MAGKKEKKEKKAKPDPAEAPVAEVEGAEGEAPAKKKLSGKTLILFIVLPAVLVLGGGGAAAMMLLGGKKTVEIAEGETGHGEVDAHGEAKPSAKKKDDKKDAHAADGAAGAEGEAGAGDDVGHVMSCAEGDPCYYAMPKIMVNLAGPEGERSPFMELELVLEAGDSATFDAIPAKMPRLKDQFQSFLRELRVEDLNGSAGSFRLRQELMKRFNVVMAPAKVDAVLIEGMLIQ